MIILRADEERNGSLIEAATLTVPFLDRIKRALACEVEHKQNGNCIVADQRKHINKLALSAQIPDRECDFCITNRNGLLHEIDAYDTSS